MTVNQAPRPPLRRWAAILLCAVFALLCLGKARQMGDGIEYLAMAQGFAARGSPDLRPSDIAALEALPPAALQRGRLKPELLAPAYERIVRDGVIEHGFARALDGSVHAIHFWMYSLLAAPFYALLAALGQNPFMALVALNLACVTAGAWRLRAWLPTLGWPGLTLFVLMGPLYYTVWSGPEVMAGCCALLASLAAMRRDPALAVALAGLGATQNPSIAGLIPAAGAYCLLYRRFPGTALLAAAPARRPWTAVVLVLAGIGAALLPYLHNVARFGMPSIIARYYNDPSLVTPERLFSFFFDLNQGLAIGFPALLSCALIVLLRVAPGERGKWLLHAAIALLLTTGLALPTLSAANWNSGALIVSRYVYWTSMPLLALCLIGLARLDLTTRVTAMVLAVLLQGLSGWQAQHSGIATFLTHGRLADWVLDHAPRYYNPDREIFLKREHRRELLPTHDQVRLHQGPHGPTKLLRYWSNHADSGGLCAPGATVLAGHQVTLASGWRYYNAPLHCADGPAQGMRWQAGALAAARAEPAPRLGGGWSGIEPDGVWTDGARSVLRLTLPPGRSALRIALDGHYYGDVRASRVTINGAALGRIALGPGPIEVPAAARAGGEIEIVLEHPDLAPAPPGAADRRVIAFFLRTVYVEFSP